MNEMRNTRCPLCGAPAIIATTENAYTCQLEIAYHYEEPHRAPEPTIMGYDLDHLHLVAKLMRQHGVTPEDLRDLKDNFQRAVDILHTEQERIAQDVAARMLAGFQPDAAPVIKLKQEEAPKE